MTMIGLDFDTALALRQQPLEILAQGLAMLAQLEITPPSPKPGNGFCLFFNAVGPPGAFYHFGNPYPGLLEKVKVWESLLLTSTNKTRADFNESIPEICFAYEKSINFETCSKKSKL